MKIKKKLNKQQTEAVCYLKNSLLIVAGAGTGKTTVITERINYLIKNNLVQPSGILALTFTQKAAAEMEERVDRILPYGITQMSISTFHSFCEEVLRNNSLHIGISSDFKLLSDSEAVQLVRRRLFDFELDYFRPLGNPNKFIEGLLEHFSRLKDENVLPADYFAWIKSKTKGSKINNDDEKSLEIKKWLELAGAFEKYEKIKREDDLMDFSDLIGKTIELFRKRPNILASFQKKYRYILVDEFQDTNIAQNELVRILTGNRGNLTVVADDDQSIYRWRGAAVSNVMYFKKSYPKAKIITLTQNYRSTQEILDRAYNLISYNNPDRLEIIEKINKRLISTKKGGSKIRLIHTRKVEDEAEAVVEEIIKLTEGDLGYTYNYSDIAILVRANNHADAFVRALARKGLPYQFLGASRLFKQPEIIDLISFLKILNNPDDSPAFYRLVSIDHFDIPVKDLIKIGRLAKKQYSSLFAAAENSLSSVDNNDRLSPEGEDKVRLLVSLINNYLGKLKVYTAGQLLYFFLQETKLINKLFSPDTADAQLKAKNVGKFFDRLKGYETDHEDASVPPVVEWLDLASEMGESPQAFDYDWDGTNAVNILTIHSAKGLEFPVVFIVNLVSQRFPTNRREETIPIPDELIAEFLPAGDYHLQEERRLFYVAMTRAKDKLYFSAADFYGDGKRAKKLSPFIYEALGDDALSQPDEKIKRKQLVLTDFAPVESKIESKTAALNLDYLSFSQIEAFRICPLHYKLNYILKIPTPPSASQSFGITIHSTLKDFYEAVIQGQKPTRQLMMKIYDNNWINEGYLGLNHKNKFYEKGKFYLSGFLKEGFDARAVPAALEMSFTVPLPELGFRPLRIGGKIDRIDVGPEGQMEIIDYKTGATIPTQKEVDGNLQLSFYALAATLIKDDVFPKQLENIKLSLYFLDTQEKISTVRSQQNLKDAVEDIHRIRNEIETSTFLCSGGPLCRRCEYFIFCSQNAR